MVEQAVLSADSHVIEPPDVWAARMAPGLRERAPRIERRDEGDFYTIEGQHPLSVAGLSAAGKFATGVDAGGRWEKAVLRGAYDPHARLAEVEEDGIVAEVLYPTVGLGMFAIDDPALRGACFRAYNDWIAEFCAAYPDRLKGVGMVDTEEVGATVAELKRLRELNLVGAMISVLPDSAAYVQPEFDPFWATAAELKLPVSLHVLTNRRARNDPQRTVGEYCTVSVFVQITLVDLIYGGVFVRHPDLKVISVEHGGGWVPYLMQSMDSAWHSRQASFEPGLKASDYFRRNIRLTFMRDNLLIKSRHEVGLDVMMWSTDFPHRASTYPHSREILANMMAGVPAAEQRQIVYDNAAALYGFN
jgi:predicted TIM-barrel fold metal-dependent hydrolase